MRTTRTLAALVLACALVAPTSALALPALWADGQLAQLWDSVRAVLNLPWTTAKDGLCMDPDGAPCTPEGKTSDGALIDPDGVPAPATGIGVAIDPDGASGD